MRCNNCSRSCDWWSQFKAATEQQQQASRQLARAAAGTGSSQSGAGEAGQLPTGAKISQPLYQTLLAARQQRDALTEQLQHWQLRFVPLAAAQQECSQHIVQLASQRHHWLQQQQQQMQAELQTVTTADQRQNQCSSTGRTVGWLATRVTAVAAKTAAAARVATTSTANGNQPAAATAARSAEKTTPATAPR